MSDFVGLCLCGKCIPKEFPTKPLSFSKHTKEFEMTENELATIAVDIAFKIHNTLGPGLLESVYETAFCFELDKRNIKYTRQQGIPVFYEDTKLDLGFRSDIIIEGKLLIEIKSVAAIEKVFHKTVLTYLKHTNLKLGLLINFNVNLIKDGIHRKILGQLLD